MEDGSGPSHTNRTSSRGPNIPALDHANGIALQELENGAGNCEESSTLRQRPRSIGLDLGSAGDRNLVPDVYLGSYGKTYEYARSSPRVSLDVRGPYGSTAKSPRASASHLHLQHLLPAVDVSLDSYGLSELRGR